MFGLAWGKLRQYNTLVQEKLPPKRKVKIPKKNRS